MEVPCTIQTSKVVEHSDSDGSTYSVEVSYRYKVNGQPFVSSRYKFMTGSSSGHSGKQAVVDALPPGKQTVCYVDPNNPAEAVIERGFTSDLLFGLIPLVFVMIGAGGLIGMVVYKGKKIRPSGSPGPSPPRPGPVTLKPTTSPGTRLGCAIGFSLFWNGIVSIFLFQVIDGWRHGHGEGCMTIFLVPFVLVGIGGIGAIFYYFLALFNPRPTLKLSSGVAALGETIELEWETEGNVNRVTSFAITLEGREEATYRRGTTTTTDKSVFTTIELAKSKGRDFRRGKVKVAIPADTMHSFAAKNNKIVWCLKVKGDIPKWPDVNEEFAFEVRPQRLAAGGRT